MILKTSGSCNAPFSPCIYDGGGVTKGSPTDTAYQYYLQRWISPITVNSASLSSS
jgi:hypothetical protein